MTAKGRGGLIADAEQAVALYRAACLDSFGLACKNLGESYDRGVGVRQDPKLALEFHSQGCELGNYAACEWLVTTGTMLIQRDKDPKDRNKAAGLFRLACPTHPRGCLELGRLTGELALFEGAGVPAPTCKHAR